MNIIQTRSGWFHKYMVDTITNSWIEMEDNILSGKNPMRVQSQEEIYRSNLKLAKTDIGIVYMHSENKKAYEYTYDNSINDLSNPLIEVEYKEFIRWARGMDV